MAAVIAISMLPATEKLSIQSAFFVSLIRMKTAIARAAMQATASGSQLPVKVRTPFPETICPI